MGAPRHPALDPKRDEGEEKQTKQNKTEFYSEFTISQDDLRNQLVQFSWKERLGKRKRIGRCRKEGRDRKGRKKGERQGGGRGGESSWHMFRPNAV